MNKIRWGIIGCGDVTEVKSGPGFQKAQGSELVAVMRRNRELAKDYALRHQVPRWYDKAEALIDDENVDAVYVATPPSSHKLFAVQVAKAGKPVYVEKPMALNVADCKEMIAACETLNTPLYVAYYRRGLQRFLKIKSLLEEGAIGNVRLASVVYCRAAQEKDRRGEKHWRVNPSISGGGYFFDLAPHAIDILLFLLGEVVSVKGFSGNQAKLYDAEDIVSAAIVFESGVHATCIWNFNAHDKTDRLEIIGEKGKVTCAVFGHSPIILENEKGEEAFEFPVPQHIQQPFIQTMVNELLGKGKCLSTCYTAIQTTWMMEELCGKRG